MITTTCWRTQKRPLWWDPSAFQAITIRKSQVLAYVTKEELDEIISFVNRHVPVIDVGYHIGGKYGQLHAHLLCVKGKCPNWKDGYFIHRTKLRSLNFYDRYIHRDDWAHPAKLDQILAKNEVTSNSPCDYF